MTTHEKERPNPLIRILHKCPGRKSPNGYKTSCYLKTKFKNNNKKMENPNIKTKVVHSQTKSAWNIVGKNIGGKYKIARIPYVVSDNQELSDKNRIEAFKHAKFISHCFNHSDSICAVK